MHKIIFDTSVLSNFALSDLLFIIKKLYQKRSLITDFVRAEIQNGINSGHEKLIDIQKALKNGWMKEIYLKRPIEKRDFAKLSVSLGFGEASSIALAKSEGLVFACDDKVARNEALLFDIRLTGTIGILRKAMDKKIISRREANVILKKMIRYGFFSPIKTLG